MKTEKTPRQIMEEAAEQLRRQADVAEVLRETQGEYVETFTDPENAGSRFYIDSDGVRVYLGPREDPPKKGDPQSR